MTPAAALAYSGPGSMLSLESNEGVGVKTIGLIGGMSWESSSVYYTLINRGVRERLGKSRSASCVMWSFDFQEIEDLQYAGDWTPCVSGCSRPAVA